MPTTLLLADDSSTIQRVVALTFAQEDVRVISVADGEQALQSVASEQPDIILADAGMPKLDGYALSSRLKASPELRHIPVLLLAGAFEPVDQKRLKDAQCDGVLVKPFEPRVLVTRVQELLDSARAQRVADSTPRQATAPNNGQTGQATTDAPGHTVPSWYRERAGTTARPEAPVLDAADLDRRLGQLVKDPYAPAVATKPAGPPSEPAKPVVAAASPRPSDARDQKTIQAPTPSVSATPVKMAVPPAPPAPPPSFPTRAAAPVDTAELDRKLEHLVQRPPATPPDVSPSAAQTLLREDAPVVLTRDPTPQPIVRPDTRPAVLDAPPVAPPTPVTQAEARPSEVPPAVASPPPVTVAPPMAPVPPELKVSLAAAFAVILEAEQSVQATGSATPTSEAAVEQALRRALFGGVTPTNLDQLGPSSAHESVAKGGPAPQ